MVILVSAIFVDKMTCKKLTQILNPAQIGTNGHIYCFTIYTIYNTLKHGYVAFDNLKNDYN